MPTGLGKLYSVPIGVGTGGSATVNLNGTYNKLFAHVVVPGGAIDVQASADGTNYAVLKFGTLTATSGTVSFLSTHSDTIREIPGGMQYYKFISTLATGTATMAIRLFGSDV